MGAVLVKAGSKNLLRGNIVSIRFSSEVVPASDRQPESSQSTPVCSGLTMGSSYDQKKYGNYIRE